MYRGATFWMQALLCSIKLFRTASFSTKLPFQESYFFKKANFGKSLFFMRARFCNTFFFRRATFSERLIFQKRYVNVMQPFFEEVCYFIWREQLRSPILSNTSDFFIISGGGNYSLAFQSSILSGIIWNR